MGVNEGDGITNAISRKNENFKNAKERRKTLMRIGKQETQRINNVGYGQMQRRKSRLEKSDEKPLTKADVMS